MTPSASNRLPARAAPARRRPPALVWGLLGTCLFGAFAAALWLSQSLGPPGTPKNPVEDANALRERARALRTSGRLDEASEAVERWRSLRPGDAEAHLFLVDLSLQRGSLPGAIDGARAALRLKPEAHDLRTRLVVWLLTLGRNDEADAECHRCRESKPNDPVLKYLQADIAAKLGDARRAERLLDELLGDKPKHLAALVLRGSLYLDAGEPEKAVPLLREAVAQGGAGQRRARNFLGLALARTGQEAEAKKLLAEVQRQHTLELWEKYGKPDSPAYKVSIAEALLDTGETNEAVRLLEQVVTESPGCAAAHRLLARHYEAQRQPEKAAEHRRKAGD
jgi:predicted Zn-dependent protease